jgi:hypothetical protein
LILIKASVITGWNPPPNNTTGSTNSTGGAVIPGANGGKGDQRPPAASPMWPPPAGAKTDQAPPGRKDAPPGGNYTGWDRWLIQNFGTLEFNLLDLAGAGPSAGNKTNKTNADQLPSNDPDNRNFSVGGSWWFSLFGTQESNFQYSNQSPGGADIIDTTDFFNNNSYVILDADSNVYWIRK